MSTALTNKIGSRTAFTITLNSLANVTYVAASAIDFQGITGVTTGCLPKDIIIELELTPGTVAANNQALLFTLISMDNSNFSTGPTSGTTITNQPNLYLVGILPLLLNTTLARKGFSVLSALGFIPRTLQPVVFNDSGAALGGSGNAMYYTVVTGDAT